MAVQSSSVYTVYRKDASTWYGIIEVTMTDGRTKRRKYRMPTADATAFLSQAETDTQKMFANRDAEAEVEAGTAIGIGEATIWDTRRAYVRRAYEEEDKVKALNMFDNFYPAMKAYGDSQNPVWVAQDYADALGVELEVAQNIVTKWQDLNGNRSIIEAYEAIL